MRIPDSKDLSQADSRPAFSWPIRVYYADTDAGGVVYHSTYLDFFERARTEWVRAMGFELSELTRDRGLLFVVRAINIDYLKPALFNDLLQATVRLEQLGRSKAILAQTLERDGVLARAQVTIVSVDTASLRPIAIPPDIKEKMEGKV